MSQGQAVGTLCVIGISEQTYDRWRRKYGGLKPNQAKRLKELEQENNQLKKAVSGLTLDTLIPCLGTCRAADVLANGDDRRRSHRPRGRHHDVGGRLRAPRGGQTRAQTIASPFVALTGSSTRLIT